jgi:AhpD family alkylhydroperoxidase
LTLLSRTARRSVGAGGYSVIQGRDRGTAAPTTPGAGEHRVFLDKVHPAAWRALNGLGLKAKEAAEEAGLDGTLIELLNVRISQINGCAYCLDLHVGDAAKNGESARRLAGLSAWRDTELFTEKERAALTLAEAITSISDVHAREREGASARKHLSAEEFSAAAG